MGAYKVRRRISMVFEGERRRRRRGESSVATRAARQEPPLPLCPIRETSRTKQNKGASIPFLTLFRF